MEFLENLKELSKCPPPEAKEQERLVAYRFTSTYPPRIDDFRSWRHSNPQANTGDFFGVPPDECERRSCSIYTDEQIARKKWEQKPGSKNRFSEMRLVKLEIISTDGVIRKERNSHCSWWISRIFNPSNNMYEEVVR